MSREPTEDEAAEAAARDTALLSMWWRLLCCSGDEGVGEPPISPASPPSPYDDQMLVTSPVFMAKRISSQW
ncbi:hypothetical protein EYF80_028986 [Liparis tanakae]|uniref:Uncharacterized protein n=1 Tax=Liparis tanakae TaxID=230148 RepID=A0A4Z2H538_9TELE|nr:hypothetical protein EYF80_028986 [Liparis tanakae]